MRIWFDTEFIDDGRTVDLLSIGLVREDGRTYYAEPEQTDRSRACPWVKANVLPKLSGPIKPRHQIANEIERFVGKKPEFWAYYAAYDWVCLCQLYGRMIDVPPGWPNYVRDFKVLAGPAFRMPDIADEHNALADALQLRDEHRKLEKAP